MANSELYGKTYQIPDNVLKYIQKVLISNSTGNGVKRAKYLLKNGVITYQDLKRLKHDFDNEIKPNTAQYMLAGGDMMRLFVETTLNGERAGAKTSKKVRSDITANPNSELMPYQTPRLTEAKKKEDSKKNAIAVIVNDDNKILLLKRSDDPKQWQPGKWSLVGGAIEKGETPQKACKREIEEETGLKVGKFIKSFTIQRNPDSTEHIFACRYKGEPTDITLNDENTNYGWFDVGEINFLDIVPHLKEFITMVFKKYE